MNKALTTAIACLTALAAVAQDKADRLLGGDISMLPVYEQRGTVYRAADGTPVSLLPWLRQQGWNAMRVRLFVDPDKSPQKHKEEGVCQDIDFVVRLGRQIQQAGYQFMLDFHYSDYWADPGKQTMPQRWENIRRDNLPDSVYQYTLHTLQSMKRQGVVPELIQVGNETTNGMLWPLGKAMPLPRKAKDAAEPTAEAVAQWTEEWDYLCRLYHAGCRACREVCPDARIIIHTEKAGSWEATQSYYQQLCHHEVDYDIIGLSYYPMWHGTIANLGQNLDRLSAQFPEKDVMIVEAAAYYSHENDPWATADKYSEFYPISVEGQLAFARELVGELRRHSNVKGLFWWFPEENASGSEVTKGWLNRGLFDNHTGRALPALQAFSQFTDNKE